MAFDDCTPYPCSYEYAKQSMERTHRWALRSLKKHNKLNRDKKQNLYGVVQGSIYEDLRVESAKYIDNLNTPGIAIGGVSVGEAVAGGTGVADGAGVAVGAEVQAASRPASSRRLHVRRIGDNATAGDMCFMLQS